MDRSQVQRLVADMPPLLQALLVERFTDSPLAYHNLDHILYMLDLLDRYFKPVLSARDYRILRYIIWCHDLFYSTTAKDNEWRSANLGLSILEWPEDELLDFNLGVMATKGHETEHRLAQIAVDLDLAILAAPRPKYQQYALGIRSEYSHYPDAEYRMGRVNRVLLPFSQATILRVLSAQMGLDVQELEKRARENLLWEMSRLLSDAPSVEEALKAA